MKLPHNKAVRAALFCGLLGLGLGLIWLGAGRLVNAKVAAEARQALAGLQPAVVADFQSVDVNIFTRQACFRGVAASFEEGGGLTADSLLVLRADLSHDTPHELSASATGLRWRADLDETARRLLPPGADVRYEASLDYGYDPTSRTLTVRGLGLSQAQAFDLDCSGRFENLDLDSSLGFVGAKLARLEVRLRDRGLVRNLADNWARDTGARPEDFGAQSHGTLSGLAARANGQGNAEAARVFEVLGSFMERPGELVLTLAPAEPVSLFYLLADGNVNEMLRLLRAEASVK